MALDDNINDNDRDNVDDDNDDDGDDDHHHHHQYQFRQRRENYQKVLDNAVPEASGNSPSALKIADDYCDEDHDKNSSSNNANTKPVNTIRPRTEHLGARASASAGLTVTRLTFTTNPGNSPSLELV